ncbi:Hsp20/alpha crystallin family protein [bacterium]|jgi:HSP20 family protein|nr:Hsp20/alpha crystallin family protein [bacterium]
MFGISHPRRWQSEMDRLFEGMLGPQAPRWVQGGMVNNFPPLALWETPESYHVEAEIPGLTLEDIDIFVKDREVTISGRLQGVDSDQGTLHRGERPTGEFKREIRLPMPLDPDKVEAKLSHGVLTLDLPKVETAKGRRIAVKDGSASP